MQIAQDMPRFKKQSKANKNHHQKKPQTENNQKTPNNNNNKKSTQPTSQTVHIKSHLDHEWQRMFSAL